jgi:DNA-binding NarL/FixJ family response regulator
VIRVAIVEDHPIYRDGLVLALGRADGIEVVGAAGSVAEALRLVGEVEADVLLLDLGLPDGSGLDVLAALRAHRAPVAVVALTMAEDREVILDTVRAGAHGYLLKGAGQEEIVEAVRRAAAGGAIFGPAAADVVIAAAGSAAADPAAVLGLTPREAHVLRLLVDGLDTRALADRLGITPKTVRNQVSAVLTKLGVDNRAAAVARARAAGLRGMTRENRDTVPHDGRDGRAGA